MALSQFCELFRRLMDEPSDRKVKKHEHFMNGHAGTCLDCVLWRKSEHSRIMERHRSGEYKLDDEQLHMMRETEKNLNRLEAQLRKKQAEASASDIGEVEPTTSDLMRIANEGSTPRQASEPGLPEDGDSQACSA